MIRICTAALVLALAGKAYALSTVYTDRDEWLAAVAGPVYTEDFEGIPVQFIPGSSGGNMLATASFTIVESPFVSLRIADGLDADGTRGFQGDVTAPGDFNDLVFTQPVHAVGLDVGFIEDSLPLAIVVDGEQFALPAHAFFGLVSSNAFTTARIQFPGLGAPRFYAIDNVSSAPEPALGALLVVFVSAMACSRQGRPSQG